MALLVIALMALGPVRLKAQTAAPTAAPAPAMTPTPTPAETAGAPAPSSSSGDVERLQAMEVSNVPLEEQILPTSRPISSVYGFDDSVMDIPRNVTIISRAQMDAINIQDVTQFSELTTSSYTDSDFGSPANPTIRGQPADFFVNGMRQHTGDNGDGMPVDFNSLESVNIVPGPATAVQGASAYVGGYVDMITKQPFFDENRGFASYTVGSYDTNRWTVDDGGPINSKLAFRFSYSGEDSDGYWYYWIKQTTALYDALIWRPSDNYELFVSTNAFIADYRENFGINRPTQALISNGIYDTGTNINNGTIATAADPQNTLNVGGGPFGGDIINWGPQVPVDYHWSANGPLSHAHGQEYNVQAIQKIHVSPTLQIENNTVYGYTKRDTYNGDGYSEIDDPSEFIDNRTAFLFTLPKAEINAGFEERYQRVDDLTNFFFEPVNVWDLSSGPLRQDINFQSSQYFFSGSGALPVPGWPGRYAIAGIYSNDTNDSELVTASPYIQGTWKLAPQWSLTAGARMDFSHLGDRDPLLLTTPNTSASLGFGEPNANVSLVYKISPTLSNYITANFSENYSGDDADGGGFALYTDSNGHATLPRGLFAEESKLFEYGLKFSADDGKLFTTSDIFLQTRQYKPQNSPVIPFTFYGFETSVNYQPNRAFYATFGYSMIHGSSPASSNPYQYYMAEDLDNQLPGGPPNYYSAPSGTYQSAGYLRAEGQPINLFNGLAQYTFPKGFGIEANVIVTSPMNNDLYGYLVIPWQYDVDASIFYKIKNWEIRATVSNLTNQHNWQPSDVTYGYEGVVSEPGCEGFVTTKYKF